MKKLFILIISCLVFVKCYGQSADTASIVAATYFKEAEAASAGQKIWNAEVYGPMMFVEPYSRVTYANMPDDAGILKPDGGIYKGVLPKDVMIANTAITWQGKIWSVILWPLPADKDERVNLLIHESFHRIQAKLGLPERSPTADHLSTMDARISFLLELQALKAALNKPVEKREYDIRHALLFRSQRMYHYPKTFKNERILEMSEGLAEYTGVILGRQKDSIIQHLNHQVDTAGDRKSLICSFAYITGPLYGYLLYDIDPTWTLKVDSNSDFQILISRAYHIPLREFAVKGPLTYLQKEYNGDAITLSEKQKETKRLQTVRQYTNTFTKQPVLSIELVKMNINFNPNNLFDLGIYGTVYPTAGIKDTWGQLDVNGEGMLMKDWHLVYLPISKTADITGNTITGNGWKLNLNPGWKIIRVDSRHYKLTM